MKRIWNEEKEDYDYNFTPEEIGTIKFALETTKYAVFSKEIVRAVADLHKEFTEMIDSA